MPWLVSQCAWGLCSGEEHWAQGCESSCWGLGLASTILLPPASALAAQPLQPQPCPGQPGAAREEVPGQGNGSESANCTESFPPAPGLPNCTSAVALRCFSVLQKAQIGARAFGFIFSTSKIAVPVAETVLSTGVYPMNQQCKAGILNFSDFPGTDLA